jgi:hypothetical protein
VFSNAAKLFLESKGFCTATFAVCGVRKFCEEWFMRMMEGWKRIDNERGYLNYTTGQNLVVSKKQFGQHYVVLLFPEMRNGDEGTAISPEYATASKAEAFAFKWMEKHPKGTTGFEEK